MNKKQLMITAAAVVIIIGGILTIAALRKSGDDAPKQGDAMMQDEAMTKDGDEAMMHDEAMGTGSYISYEDYQKQMNKYDDNRVVLDFSAPWCPDCQALDKDIKAHRKDIPAGTTIVKVDYDTAGELKKKYGVTMQHTFVQVDAKGNQIKNWSGASTLATLLKNIQE